MRILSLSQRLGHNRIRELVDEIESVTQARVTVQGNSPFGAVRFRQPLCPEPISGEDARIYIDGQFL